MSDLYNKVNMLELVYDKTWYIKITQDMDKVTKNMDTVMWSCDSFQPISMHNCEVSHLHLWKDCCVVHVLIGYFIIWLDYDV